MNKRESLGLGNKEEAQRVVDAKNEAMLHVGMNLQIAQVYLQQRPVFGHPHLAAGHGADRAKKHDSTQDRWQCATKDKAFDLIRHRKVVETTAEHFLAVLAAGTVATNLYLRRTHCFAIGGDALAALAHPAQTSLASARLQAKAGRYRLLPNALAHGRSADRYCPLSSRGR